MIEFFYFDRKETKKKKNPKTKQPKKKRKKAAKGLYFVWPFSQEIKKKKNKKTKTNRNALGLYFFLSLKSLSNSRAVHTHFVLPLFDFKREKKKERRGEVK
jgi:hypothetical protein